MIYMTKFAIRHPQLDDPLLHPIFDLVPDYLAEKYRVLLAKKSACCT